MQTNYFTQEEEYETLRSKFKAEKRERRYEYKSKAVYQGQWLGNFRNGFGKMTWVDGAEYEGYWSYGHAYGKGKFTHIDGDVYEG